VAIPAVVAYNVLQKKIAEVETGVMVLGKLAGAFAEARERAGEPIPRLDGGNSVRDTPPAGVTTAAQAADEV
jgi:hypothetical protein